MAPVLLSMHVLPAAPARVTQLPSLKFLAPPPPLPIIPPPTLQRAAAIVIKAETLPSSYTYERKDRANPMDPPRSSEWGPAARGESAVARDSVYTDSRSSQSRSPTSTLEIEPTTDSKRSRRKEQCRVNQANYRKRKRNYEQQLSGYIQSLESDILELTSRKNTLGSSPDQQDASTNKASDPDHDIATVYNDIRHAPAPHGSSSISLSDQFTALMALQFEEFPSASEMVQQWTKHKRHFHNVRVQPVSSERLRVGEFVIVKMEAEWEIWFASESVPQSELSDAWWRKPFVCPVQHRFELAEHGQTISRVTSEVNLAAGLARVMKNSSTSLSQLLDELMAVKRRR